MTSLAALRLTLLAFLALGATPAGAQLSTDSNAPIDITGNAAEFQDNIAVWTGDVRVVQEASVLTADRLEAELSDDGDFTSIVATGQVRYSNGKEAITGQKAVFDNQARTITISEDVIVTQGKQVMSAGAVMYWVDTGKVKFLPAPGRRIRGVFYTEDAQES